MRIALASSLLVSLPLFCQLSEHNEWRAYGGHSDSSQYSSLNQINKANVKDLTIAWSYPTQDHKHYFFNPIVVHGLMYVMAKNDSIVALDATTGKEVWLHAGDSQSRLITNRGITYWESSDGSDRRLIYAQNNLLQTIDARNGRNIGSFGANGFVDLREGLGRNPKDLVLVQSTTPGRVFENLIILGSATNQEYESAPGDIRAYNIRSGSLAWTFHTIPHPGEFGYETWPKDAWKTVGGANSWGEMSVDNTRGIIYVPTGSPKYNFYGANRPGANLFGDCLIALDARTGKRIWHFQMVHHDIWDYDDATAPKLLTVMHDGKPLDAVAEVSKQGFLWVFNRVNGEPLWPIHEQPVPRSNMPGEQAWPTQPFPTKPPPFARQKFSSEDLSPLLEPAERAKFKDEIESARNEGLFTPPGLRNTVEMPGNNGGANWGSAAVDPDRGLLFVGSKDLPSMLKLEPEVQLALPQNGSPGQMGSAIYQAKCQLCHHPDLRGQPPAVPSLLKVSSRLTAAQIENVITHGEGLMPAFGDLTQQNLAFLEAFLQSSKPLETLSQNMTASKTDETKYRSGFGFMFAANGLSPIRPPWATLTAYDLNVGNIKWQIPIGEVPGLSVQNTGVHFPKYGPVVTAGGLIFTGTRDKKVRALDVDTGKVVWEKELNNGIEGIPAVYEMNGREYVVFCAAAQSDIRANNQINEGAYVAFALPK